MRFLATIDFVNDHGHFMRDFRLYGFYLLQSTQWQDEQGTESLCHHKTNKKEEENEQNGHPGNHLGKRTEGGCNKVTQTIKIYGISL